MKCQNGWDVLLSKHKNVPKVGNDKHWKLDDRVDSPMRFLTFSEKKGFRFTKHFYTWPPKMPAVSYSEKKKGQKLDRYLNSVRDEK